MKKSMKGFSKKCLALLLALVTVMGAMPVDDLTLRADAATGDTGVSYDCTEYCTNDAVNRACENFFQGEMNDETYIIAY